MLSEAQAIEMITRWRMNPEFYFNEVLGLHLWDKQVDIVNAIRDNRRVSVRSANGIGKTFTMSGIVLWFLNCYKDSIVITTAPTWTSVRSILWSNIRKQHSSAKTPLGGEVLDTQIKIKDGWYAQGISTKDHEKFQGYHAKNILFLFDEAPGVRPKIFEATEGSMTSEGAKWIQIGNPLSPTGPFYETFKSPLWHGMHISAFDCPNVKEKRLVIPGLTTWEWVQERKEEWGEDSPLYISRVLGNFPAEGEGTLIPLTAAEMCVDLDILVSGQKVMAIDPARFGGDMTVFAVMQGRKVFPLLEVSKRDTMEVAGIAIQYKNSNGIDEIGVDTIGIGAGVFDRLNEQRFNVTDINAAASASNPAYINLRAEMWWELAQDIRKGDISLPNDPKLLSQITSIKYKFNSKGQIQIESKEDMKKRGMKSPDRGDALAMANYLSKRLTMQLKADELIALGDDRAMAGLSEGRNTW